MTHLVTITTKSIFFTSFIAALFYTSIGLPFLSYDSLKITVSFSVIIFY